LRFLLLSGIPQVHDVLMPLARDLEFSMEAQNVWNNDMTLIMGNMNGADMVSKPKKITRSRRSINQEDNL
jgi:hypothetical protein